MYLLILLVKGTPAVENLLDLVIATLLKELNALAADIKKAQ